MIIISTIILGISYLLISFDRIPKVTIAVLGAALTLAFGIIPHDSVVKYIDFGVIILLASMMIIVHITGRSGVFNWIGIKLLKFTKGKPMAVLLYMAAFTAIASAFLDNVTTVILVLPVIFLIAKEIEADPVPFLITEILASNIGGTATLIGDPPNIIIGSAAGFSFIDFIKELAPVVIVIFLVCLAILSIMFKGDLVYKPESYSRIQSLDENSFIKDKTLLIRSVLVLMAVILGMMFGEFLHVHAYVTALAGAGALLLFESPSEILQDLEWTTIFFFIGLFIIIGGLVETGGIKLLSEKLLEFTNGDLRLTSLIVLWGSGFLSAIVDNIPYTITMTPLIKELQGSMNIVPLWWSLALGACLGGNATIIGAAANVIVSESSEKLGYHISFGKFMKYGLIITLISLIISSMYLYLRFLI